MGDKPITPRSGDEPLTSRWKRIAAVHAKQTGARDGDLVRIEGEPGDWIVDGMTVKPVPPKP